MQAVDEILLEVTSMAADIIVCHFPALCGTVKQAAKMLIKTQRNEAHAFVKDWIDCEKNPATMNHSFKSDTETLRKDALGGQLRPAFDSLKNSLEQDAHHPDEEFRVHRVGEHMGELERRVQETLKVGKVAGAPTDSSAEAMEAVEMGRMLSAYWKVATSRFVDVIVMGIDQVHTLLLSLYVFQLQSGLSLTWMRAWDSVWCAGCPPSCTAQCSSRCCSRKTAWSCSTRTRSWWSSASGLSRWLSGCATPRRRCATCVWASTPATRRISWCASPDARRAWVLNIK
jgi:hypothetical protein